MMLWFDWRRWFRIIGAHVVPFLPFHGVEAILQFQQHGDCTSVKIMMIVMRVVFLVTVLPSFPDLRHPMIANTFDSESIGVSVRIPITELLLAKN